MSEGAEKMMKWLPLVVLAASIVASAVTAQNQIKTLEKSVEKMAEDVEENEDDISEVRRRQLQDTAEIKGDVKLILKLLEQRTNE